MSKVEKSFNPDDLEYPVSYKAIHMWYTSMFEKLGWMTLAARDGRDYKIDTYKQSLANLKAAITEKHKNMKDEDKKDDLAILLSNVGALIR